MNNDILLNERYEIEEILGQGGFATTYLAVDTETQQKCAIKCLSFRKIEEWKTWELFEREAKILKNLDHPQIPKYIDFFSVETEEGIELYLVQEYVEGKSLAQLVREGKYFSEQEVIEIGLEVSNILEYLHSFSPPIIHRDIKPSNIILTQFPSREGAGVGLVYLIDFGAVREKMISDYSTVGGGSTIVGTYGYMPFEQFEGQAVPASDIFSLGITMIHLLSGKEPIAIDKKGKTLNYHPHVNISRSFIAVLNKMIAREYKRRYQNASQVIKDFKKLLAGKLLFRLRLTARNLAIGITIGLLVLGLGFSLLKDLLPAPQQTTAPLPSASSASETEVLETLLYKSRSVFLSRKDDLGALLMSIKAGKRARRMNIPLTLKYQAMATLREVLNGVVEQNRLAGHQSSIVDLAFSPDGKLLASGSYDDTVKLWNVADGSLINTLEAHTDNVDLVSFSPDGRLLATAGWDKIIRIWDVAHNKLLTTFREDHVLARGLAFSPDGKTLASVSSSKEAFKLWDVSTGERIRTFDIPHVATFFLNSVAFSPDSKMLASVLLNTPPDSVSLNEDNSMVISRGDTPDAGTPRNRHKTISLWDTTDGKLIMTLSGHAVNIESLAFSPDRQILASGSEDNTIKLWNIADGKLIKALHGHSASVQDIAFSPDGNTLVSGSKDKTVKLWHVITGELITTLSGHSGLISSVAFSLDGTLLASGGIDNTIKLWNIDHETSVKTLGGHTGPIPSVAFSPDGTLLASGSVKTDRAIKLWDISKGKAIRTLPGDPPFYEILSVTFSPDGTMLASAENFDGARLWNVHDGTEIRKFPNIKSSGTRCIEFTPDGKMLAIGTTDYGTVFFWDIQTGRQIKAFEGDFKVIESLKFSPDGTKLASGSYSGVITLWNVTNGKQIMRLEGSRKILSLSFSPDGTKLAAGSGNGIVKLWNVEDGSEIATLQGHTTTVYSVDFSPDGKMLASGSGDWTIKLWNVENSSEITTLQGHTGAVLSVDFSPDGKFLASSSGDGDKTIKLWSVDLDDLLLQGCEWVHGYLKNNPNVSEEDRTVCDDILATKNAKKR